jgi:hypothetical protein
LRSDLPDGGLLGAEVADTRLIFVTEWLSLENANREAAILRSGILVRFSPCLSDCKQTIFQ